MNEIGFADIDSAIADIVDACKNVFNQHLRCVLLEGSVNRGDLIQGYSDVDIHVYLSDSVFVGERSPKLEYTLKFQEAIGSLKPKKYGVSQFQVSFLSAEKGSEWPPPIEGTYRVLYGTPVPAMKKPTLQEYINSEKKQLANVGQTRTDLLRRFIDKTNASTAPIVRLTGTCLKGMLYALAVVLTSDPETALKQTLNETLDTISSRIQGSENARSFFNAVKNWPEIEANPEKAREAFAFGIRAMESIEEACSSSQSGQVTAAARANWK